jgi:N,N'-diacetyllegionaminate synthase
MKCYVIAEAGVNHNGSDDLALQLVDIAANAGADAVKFQTFKAASLVTKGAATADYQKQQTDSDDQYSMLKQLEMSDALHHKLIDRCQQNNIEFMSTPFDIEAAKFLLHLGMRRLKVPSGELTNLPLIRELTALNMPMILSTGMASMNEVIEAVDVIVEVRDQKEFDEPLIEMLTILHCTSNYPAKIEDVNLRAMQTMCDILKLPVGYSDHTDGIFIAVAAVAMGATVIEKHFTLDKNLPGPDQKASLEPDELALMVEQIRQVETSLGDGVKEPRLNEFPVRELVRRSVTLLTDKPAGSLLQKEDLGLLRPGTGIPPKKILEVVGKCLKCAQKSGAALTWDDLI